MSDVAEIDTRVRDELEAAIGRLREASTRWAATGASARAALLRETHTEVARVADRWVATASRVKGLEPGSRYVGEEWTSGPYAVLTGLATLIDSLDRIAAGGSPLDGVRTSAAPGGRLRAHVLPSSAQESLLLSGHRAEVWFEPGVTLEQARAEAGLASRHGAAADEGAEESDEPRGGVGLVLGAGNITSIPPLDVLYELLAHDRVVLLKLNPVMQAMLDVYRDAFAPLVRAGALEIVNGGGEVGAFLTGAAGIDHVHITGSIRTHDAIVWGAGAEAEARRAAGDPKLPVPITSELGGVSPVIVVPGAWTDADLAYQAAHVATMRLHNDGCNCIAAQAVIVSADWPQKPAFLEHLARVLAEVPSRPRWYPGEADRVEQACAAYPDARRAGDRVLVDATAHPEALETTEYFAPVLGVIELPGTGAEFLHAAVAHANERLVGTLGANIIVAPADRRALGAEFTRAIVDLRYGTIGVNAWTAVGFLTAGAPWGAFPGATLENTESGIGVVHNGHLLARTERTVVSGPFRPAPRSVLHGENSLMPVPPWFVTARTAATTGERLTRWAAQPSWARMPAVFASAFRA